MVGVLGAEGGEEGRGEGGRGRNVEAGDGKGGDRVDGFLGAEDEAEDGEGCGEEEEGGGGPGEAAEAGAATEGVGGHAAGVLRRRDAEDAVFLDLDEVVAGRGWELGDEILYGGFGGAGGARWFRRGREVVLREHVGLR